MTKKREIDVILRDLAKRRSGKIDKRLDNIVDNGSDALFLALIERCQKAMPQKLGLDKDTCFTLAAMLRGK